MRALIQRVTEAAVRVDGQTIGQTGPGLLILVCAMQGDDATQAEALAAKISKLRIFQDEAGKMNRSVIDTHGSALVVSQFTLLGDARKGRRPSFIEAARPEQAEAMYDQFCEAARLRGLTVHTGRFRTHMDVELVNDGPVTLIVDSRS